VPGPVANDTRQSQDGIVKNGLHRPSLSAIILSSRPLALILIAAPFSSRLSRYSMPQLKRINTRIIWDKRALDEGFEALPQETDQAGEDWTAAV